MKRTFLQKLFAGFIIICCLTRGASAQGSAKSTAPQFNIPVRFEENRGQFSDLSGKPAPGVFYRLAAPGVEAYLTSRGLTYVFGKETNASGETGQIKWNAVDLDLKGATISKHNIESSGQLDYHFNYFFPHCSDGLYAIRSYERITVRNIYPGIDWVLYSSSEKGLKYDFLVHPGADISHIRMQYRSLAAARMRPDGSISLNTPLGAIVDGSPFTYIAGSNMPVTSSFSSIQTRKDGEIYCSIFGFNVGPFSPGDTLVIDPQLTWSTFYGGNTDEGTYSIECDASGNVFAAGSTGSFNLPLLNASTFYHGTKGGLTSQFIMKFNPSNSLVWATYYGGTGAGVYQYANDIAIDGSGNVFMCGTTNATNYPVQNNSTFFQGTIAGSDDACMVKFDNSGNRIWATHFGGTSVETGNSISIDGSGNVFLTGTSQSTNMPLMNAGTYYQSTFTATTAGMIVKFSNAGTLQWSTFFEGLNPLASAVDHNNNLLLTGAASSGLVVQNPGGGAFFQGSGGAEAALVKFTNSGSLLWSTFLGGSGIVDQGKSITSDKYGNVYVAGITTSTNFPLQNAGGFFQNTIGSTGLTISDAFLTKFAPSGALRWSTFLGGSDNETFFSSNNLCTDTCANVYVSFCTKSSNMFTQPACEGGFIDSVFDFASTASTDIYVARFDTATDCKWATYAGGNGIDIRASLAVDPVGNLYMTGQWTAPFNQSANYVIVGGENRYTDSTGNGGSDVYFMKFSPAVGSASLSYGGKVICRGDTGKGPVSFLPSGGSYSATSGLSINPVSGIITPSASAAGVHTVSYSFSYSGCACYGAASTTSNVVTTVTIGAVPILTVTSPGTICPQQAAVITAAGADTYTWSNFSMADSIVVSPAVTTVFTVTGSHTLGCKSSATVQLVIVQPASVTISGPASVCFGDSVLLTASGAVSYSWSNGALTASTLVSPTLNTIFTVTATDSSGCQTGALKPVSVLPVPAYAISGASAICSGITTTLATATPPSISFTWNTGSTQPVISVAPMVTTVYSNTFVGQGGCNHVAMYTLNVIPLPVVSISAQPSVCAGAVFSATASGAQSYTWSNGSVSPIFTQVVSAAQIVFVKGETSGCLGYDTVNVNVFPAPSISITPSGLTLCTGDSFTLGAAGASGYTWSTGANGSQASFTAAANSVYAVTGINPDGCAVTVTIPVTVNECSGLYEPVSGARLRIYPNPNKGEFIVFSSADILLELVNETGQLVRTIGLSGSNNFTVRISGLAAGVYFLKNERGESAGGLKIIVAGD